MVLVFFPISNVFGSVTAFGINLALNELKLQCTFAKSLSFNKHKSFEVVALWKMCEYETCSQTVPIII